MAPKTLNRSITTCVECRKRKTRCDRARPTCGQCRLNSATCVYPDQIPPTEQRYQFIAEGGSSRAPRHLIEVPVERIAALERRVDSLSQLLKSLQESRAPPVESQARNPSVEGGIEPIDTSTRTSDRRNGSYLSIQSGGRVRFVQPSFWALVCQEAAELDDLINGQDQDNNHGERLDLRDRTSDPEETSTDTSMPTFIPPATGPEVSHDLGGDGSTIASSRKRSPATIQIFLEQYPSRDVCDNLLNWYFYGVHPIAPLVHGPTFWLRYERFWESFNQSEARRSISLQFPTLLVALLYAGSLARPHENSPNYTQSTTDSKELSKALRNLLTSALELSCFPHSPSLDTLRAYMVHQSVLLKEEDPLPCSAFVGLALRVAHVLGLQTDPSHFQSFSAAEAEERRRTWWHIVHIDATLAMAAGVPPMIDFSSWDVRQVSALGDEDIETQPDGSPNQSRLSHSPCMAGLLVRGKLQFIMALRRTMQLTSNGRHVTIEELGDIRHIFDELGHNLNHAISQITLMHFEPQAVARSTPSYENNSTLQRWSKMLLSLFVDQRYSLISALLLQRPRIDGWNALYEEVMEACVSCLSKYAQLSVLDEFQQFHWSWPGNHQPLRAIIILLNDVMRNPHSNRVTRACHAVDIIFALASPDDSGSIATDPAGEPQRRLAFGTSSVWSSLRRFRAKAWQTADRDPIIPWSRDEAITFCRAQYERHATTDTTVHGTEGFDSNQVNVTSQTAVSDPREGVRRSPAGTEEAADPQHGFQDLTHFEQMGWNQFEMETLFGNTQDPFAFESSP